MKNHGTGRAPMVSVVMPVYNRATYVAAAIDSIASQTFEDFEFIIVDDGSTDGTQEVIAQSARQDRRLRPFFLDHGGGPRAANFGIERATGTFIARMDSDDIALPHRFETQLRWMEANRVDLCGSLVATIGQRHDLFWYPEDHGAIARELFFRVGMLHPVVMARGEVWRNNRYDETAEFDDYEMWTRLAADYRMGNIQEVLLHYRCHDQQVQVVQNRRFRSDLQRFRFRYFYRQFPKTPLTDYLALARVSDQRPMTGIPELRRAGQWLVDLAQHPDRLLRRRMARRWRETCERSGHLGDACQDVFLAYQGQFQVDDEGIDARGIA